MRISDWSSDVCSSDLLVHRIEGVAQRNFLRVLVIRIIQNLWIDIEQDGHANFLTRLQRLLRKTEALYLGEKGSCLRWRHIEGGGSGHRFVGHILGDEDRHITCATGDLVDRKSTV